MKKEICFNCFIERVGYKLQAKLNSIKYMNEHYNNFSVRNVHLHIHEYATVTSVLWIFIFIFYLINKLNFYTLVNSHVTKVSP